MRWSSLLPTRGGVLSSAAVERAHSDDALWEYACVEGDALREYFSYLPAAVLENSVRECLCREKELHVLAAERLVRTGGFVLRDLLFFRLLEGRVFPHEYVWLWTISYGVLGGGDILLFWKNEPPDVTEALPSPDVCVGFSSVAGREVFEGELARAVWALLFPRGKTLVLHPYPYPLQQDEITAAMEFASVDSSVLFEDYLEPFLPMLWEE